MKVRTSMSTWPTPVERRFGLRRRCITLSAACVLAGDALLDDLLSVLLSRSLSSSPDGSVTLNVSF